jgi:predicted RNA binding protein YcfA (HicA-like mRNA interferase family)
MPKIPGISAEQAVRVFEKMGYRIVRQGKHIVMSDGNSRLIIPRHNSIHSITMGTIAKDAGLSPQEFKKLL